MYRLRDEELISVTEWGTGVNSVTGFTIGEGGWGPGFWDSCDLQYSRRESAERRGTGDGAGSGPDPAVQLFLLSSLTVRSFEDSSSSEEDLLLVSLANSPGSNSFVTAPASLSSDFSSGLMIFDSSLVFSAICTVFLIFEFSSDSLDAFTATSLVLLTFSSCLFFSLSLVGVESAAAFVAAALFFL